MDSPSPGPQDPSVPPGPVDYVAKDNPHVPLPTFSVGWREWQGDSRTEIMLVVPGVARGTLKIKTQMTPVEKAPTILRNSCRMWAKVWLLCLIH